MPDFDTERTIDLTPRFNYTLEVEILKRFLERLAALLNAFDPNKTLNAEQLIDFRNYVAANLDNIRGAMSEILTSDIERQIQITKVFPLRYNQLGTLHPFEAASDDPDGKYGCIEDGLKRSSPLHTL